MIRNEFVYELGIDLDIEYLAELVSRKQNESVEGRAIHHRLVKDDPYMMSLQAQYPLLSPVYNIYPLPPNVGIPLHVDTDRSCAFNIPIKGTEDTHTIFYTYDEPLVMEYNSKRIFDVIKSPVTEKFRHTLLTPLLINNSVPHEVINSKDTWRTTISWSLNKGVTFEQAIRCFDE